MLKNYKSNYHEPIYIVDQPRVTYRRSPPACHLLTFYNVILVAYVYSGVINHTCDASVLTADADGTGGAHTPHMITVHVSLHMNIILLGVPKTVCGTLREPTG